MPYEDLLAELSSLVDELGRLVAELREAVRRLAELELPRRRELARQSLEELERAYRRGLDGGWLP